MDIEQRPNEQKTFELGGLSREQVELILLMTGQVLTAMSARWVGDLGIKRIGEYEDFRKGLLQHAVATPSDRMSPQEANEAVEAAGRLAHLFLPEVKRR